MSSQLGADQGGVRSVGDAWLNSATLRDHTSALMSSIGRSRGPEEAEEMEADMAG